MKHYIDSKSSDYQESFVLNMLDEKYNGFYVEVGSGKPIFENNTYLLESQFNWSGVGIDLNENNVYEYKKIRKNPCLNSDAIDFNYEEYFKANNFPNQIDFLQIDIDESNKNNMMKDLDKYSGNGNLLALINIPLTRYRFSVIIFEHEVIKNYKNKYVRDAQREILSGLDYFLMGQTHSEDWWVDPKAIDLDDNKNKNQYLFTGNPIFRS